MTLKEQLEQGQLRRRRQEGGRRDRAQSPLAPALREQRTPRGRLTPRSGLSRPRRARVAGAAGIRSCARIRPGREPSRPGRGSVTRRVASATTSPIQVIGKRRHRLPPAPPRSPVGWPGSRRSTARSPRRRVRRTRPGPAPSAAATSATPGASGIAASSSSIATPLARARCSASVASPSEMSSIALTPAPRQCATGRQSRQRRRVALAQRRAASTASSSAARPSSSARPAAEPPSAPVTPTRSPGRAPSRPTSSPGSSAQPTTVNDTNSAGAAVTSPPAIVTPSSSASAAAPAISARACSSSSPLGQPQREVRLPRRAARPPSPRGQRARRPARGDRSQRGLSCAARK